MTNLAALMLEPWTVIASPADDPGEVVVRVAELPGMIVIGTPKEVEAEFWHALRASLLCRLECGDAITRPRRTPSPISYTAMSSDTRQFARDQRRGEQT